jgi:K+-sensing histidine kinase KdpD
VVVIDPEGQVELANQMARQLLGVEPARGGKPESVWRPPDPLRQPLADAFREQRPVLTERFDQAVTFHHAGEDRFFLPQVRPIRSSAADTVGAAIVLNDVTQFRLLDRLKSDLVATVSHELKTPLTSVRLAVHVLLEETVGPLEPKPTELLVDADSPALAQQLGGISMPYTGESFEQAVAQFVREYQITHIVMGRSLRPWYARWFGQSALDRLLSAVPQVDVTLVDAR